MRIGYRVPRRKDADIAPIIAGFASYMTGYKYDEAVIEGGLWHNRQERRWTFHPAGGELVFGYDSNADRIRLLNQARSHGYDVGWKGASKTINQLVAASVATGVPHARYLSTLRPVTAQILQGNRFPTAGAPAVADYVFSMFREINGAPALNLEFTAAVHPSGQLHYLDTTGIELDLTGDPGKEKPIGRTIEAVSIVSAGMASEYFARDTALEFPGNQIVVLASLSAYAAPTPSAEFLEPMRVFYFVPRAGNVVQPARWWGYRVDQQDPKFVQLPTTLSGTLQ